MQLFFIPDYSGDDIITLDKEESSHISKVLRMKEGGEIFLTDGKGNLFTCRIAESTPKRCSVKVVSIEQNYQQRQFKIHLAIAPTKNINRIEWLLEKAVEMGIDEITPIVTEHSERRNINAERLEKIIISAMKQSIKCFKPKLNGLTDFSSLINNLKEEKKYLCCCSEEEKILIKDDYQPNEDVILFIGPEGDFSDKEISLAKDAGCKLITLGEQRLRTETAALYAISNIHFLNQ
ncbi:MAG: 16S rRNA (uracil(1498)-N(3))-methyltransferase [Bacteroidales bacterium]|nr:16S rRNA (uracil(1498)-N(3))-methyltransferase [Bacteroidales bacterium]